MARERRRERGREGGLGELRIKLNEMLCPFKFTNNITPIFQTIQYKSKLILLSKVNIILICIVIVAL